ncbi:hypothetical protein VTH06DRAFT_4671 [Thermothelomyces fergusii]
MRLHALVALLPALGAQGIRIIQSNDDGWAEQYIRSFHNDLIAAGHDVVLSAPAGNKSGSGSLDIDPSPRRNACQYDSCPAGSGPIGRNETSPQLNWVNSYPATSMRNLYLVVHVSGTVGAAVHAAKNAKIPAIAFSGASVGALSWDRPEEQRSRVYAELATALTNAVVAGGKPYLPEDVFLNLNFPKVDGRCTDPSQFEWVLTRINEGILSAPDTEHCGSTRLPHESSVVGAEGCYIAVSVGDANDKSTASAEKQAVVRDKLASLWTCFPSSRRMKKRHNNKL